jgi:hypothetical protein
VMSGDWYYAKNGTSNGPLTSRELLRLVLEGTLLPTDLVWKEGLEDWQPASSVKGLFDSSSSPSPLHSTPTSASSPKGESFRDAATERSISNKNPKHGKFKKKSKSRSTIHTAGRLLIIAGIGMFSICLGLPCLISVIGPTQRSNEDRSWERPTLEGWKPEVSLWDRGVPEVKKFLAETANDPYSLEYVEWYPVVKAEKGWLVRVKYRERNIFNAKVLRDRIFNIRNGSVHQVSDTY